MLNSGINHFYGLYNCAALATNIPDPSPLTVNDITTVSEKRVSHPCVTLRLWSNSSTAQSEDLKAKV
jgi:hypothetical protein